MNSGPRPGARTTPTVNEIGAPGFEPGTSPTRTVRATRLRHAPRARSLAASANDSVDGVSDLADRMVHGACRAVDDAVHGVGRSVHDAAHRAAAGDAVDGAVDAFRDGVCG